MVKKHILHQRGQHPQSRRAQTQDAVAAAKPARTTRSGRGSRGAACAFWLGKSRRVDLASLAVWNWIHTVTYTTDSHVTAFEKNGISEPPPGRIFTLLITAPFEAPLNRPLVASRRSSLLRH